VPERREEVTTEGGLEVAGNLKAVTDVCRRMKERGIEVSLFITPDPAQVDAAAKTGADFIELHTGAYAEEFAASGGKAEGTLRQLAEAAERAREQGLRVNAGHGLSLANLSRMLETTPHLEELNIGHSLVSHAVSVGLAASVREFLAVMQGYRLGSR
jgi:pyridoxine 5-phosphate synthase